MSQAGSFATGGGGSGVTSVTGTSPILANGTSGIPETGNVILTLSPVPGGGLITLTGTLTSSQIKNLHATPITFLAAQGVGTVIVIISIAGKMNYGGNNVFTAAAAQTVTLNYGTGNSIGSIMSNADIKAASTQFTITTPASQTPATNAAVDNVTVNFFNSVATEIGGNAANDNTITYSITYRVVSI